MRYSRLVIFDVPVPEEAPAWVRGADIGQLAIVGDRAVIGAQYELRVFDLAARQWLAPIEVVHTRPKSDDWWYGISDIECIDAHHAAVTVGSMKDGEFGPFGQERRHRIDLRTGVMTKLEPKAKPVLSRGSVFVGDDEVVEICTRGLRRYVQRDGRMHPDRQRAMKTPSKPQVRFGGASLSIDGGKSGIDAATLEDADVPAKSAARRPPRGCTSKNLLVWGAFHYAAQVSWQGELSLFDVNKRIKREKHDALQGVSAGLAFQPDESRLFAYVSARSKLFEFEVPSLKLVREHTVRKEKGQLQALDGAVAWRAHNSLVWYSLRDGNRFSMPTRTPPVVFAGRHESRFYGSASCARRQS